MSLKLAVVVAHPDDEAYGVGGTLAQCARAGHKTGLITMTRGGSGRTLGLCAQEDLPTLRSAELQKSVEVLGVHDFRLYDFPDAAPVSRVTQGEKTTPGQFVGGLQTIDFSCLVEQLRKDLVEMQPEVLVCFAPDGSNRHPDHVVSSAATTKALELGAMFETTRVYFFASPRVMNPDWADTWQAPTHGRDVTDVLDLKLQSIAAHRSQALSTVDFFSRAPDRIRFETFRRFGAVVPSQRMANDL